MSPHHTKLIIMQKNLFYIFLCCLLSHLSMAQNYIPFDFDNGFWEEEYYNMQSERSKYNYFTDGDTIINNLTYKKLYKAGERTYSFGVSWIPWSSFSNDFGFIREDNNKKIYHIGPFSGGTEELLYDFNMVVGDTISIPTIAYSYDSAVVVAIDSVSTCSTIRRRYELNPVGTQLLGGPLYWTEGVGSSHGLIPRYNWFESGVIYVCYSDSTCANPCANFLSTTTVKNQSSKLATIYPNPSSETSIIQLNNRAINTKIQVMNNLGQIILDKEIQGQEEVLNLSNWSTGIYYIKLEYDQQIETHYLIKQ